MRIFPEATSIFRVVALALLVLTSPASAEVPDWDAVAAVEEVNVITIDEDGEERDTTVWLAVVDGQGYIRTGGTNWGENISRDPLLVLRIEGTEFPLRAEFVEDDDLRATIKTTYNEKYGLPDTLLGFVRGDRPKMMRLLAR